MIKRLSVSNYRSLGERVDVELGPFTALVGPNGAGKSNVVDVLRFVSDAMHMGLSGAITHRNGIDAVRRWSGGHPFNSAIHLDLILDGGLPGSYSFELRGDSAEEYKVRRDALGRPPARAAARLHGIAAWARATFWSKGTESWGPSTT